MKLISDQCSKCEACISICPKKAIIPVDSLFMPLKYIDEKKCINCGLCKKVCPNLIYKKNPSGTPYACFAKDLNIRKEGSSGGIFPLISRTLFKQGYKICGACFDKEFYLRHRIIEKEENLPLLFRSKYMHSDLSGVFRSIKMSLKKNEKILFCGTPCQCSALKNYLFDCNTENIILVDFVCHGTPDNKVFKNHIEHLNKSKHFKILDYEFRSKKGYDPHTCTLRIKKKDKIYEKSIPYYFDTYYKAFRGYSLFYDACYSCLYTTKERVSDLTLCDAWGIEQLKAEGFQSAGKTHGCSIININSEKGNELFKQIKDQLNLLDIPNDFLIKNNNSFTKACSFDKEVRNSFLNTQDTELVLNKFYKTEFKDIIMYNYHLWKSLRKN